MRSPIVWFVLSGMLCLGIASSGELRAAGWIILVPVWLAGSLVFWLWTPSYLLHRQIALRPLFPGALLLRRRSGAPQLGVHPGDALDGLCDRLARLERVAGRGAATPGGARAARLGGSLRAGLRQLLER